MCKHLLPSAPANTKQSEKHHGLGLTREQTISKLLSEFTKSSHSKRLVDMVV